MRMDARFLRQVHRASPRSAFGGSLRSGQAQKRWGGVIDLSSLNRLSRAKGLDGFSMGFPSCTFFFEVLSGTLAVYLPRSLAISRMILSSVAKAARLSNFFIRKKGKWGAAELTFLIDGLDMKSKAVVAGNRGALLTSSESNGVPVKGRRYCLNYGCVVAE